MCLSERIFHHHLLFISLRWNYKDTEATEFLESDRCEAFYPSFRSGSPFVVRTRLFEADSSICCCDLLNHVLQNSHFLCWICTLLFAHYPVFNYIFTAAHCCVLTACNLILVTLQPGGCLNPVISARCLQKNTPILCGCAALKHVGEVNKQ